MDRFDEAYEEWCEQNLDWPVTNKEDAVSKIEELDPGGVVDPDSQCFVKAKAKGEPTFTLRAQDISAPWLVEQWILINKEHLGNDHPKIQEAQLIAGRMRAWTTRRLAD